MAFVGRVQELRTLNYHYSLDKFQMLVIYGRRRVGKTALITQFCEDKPTHYGSPQRSKARP